MRSERIAFELRRIAKSGYWIGGIVFSLLILFAAFVTVTEAPNAAGQVRNLAHALDPVLLGAWIVAIVASFVASLVDTRRNGH